MSYFTSKTLLAAKAMAQKDWTYPSVLLAARHMADNGKTVEEIQEFLGWNCNRNTALRRLKKYRITPFSKQPNSHRGMNTSIGSLYEAAQNSFAAKMCITRKVVETFECASCHKTTPRRKYSWGLKCQKCMKKETALKRQQKYYARKTASP